MYFMVVISTWIELKQDQFKQVRTKLNQIQTKATWSFQILQNIDQHYNKGRSEAIQNAFWSLH